MYIKRKHTDYKIFIQVLIAIILFINISNTAWSDNYTEIPKSVIKFAEKHHCTDLESYYKNKSEQYYNKEYDIYKAKYKSKDYNCIILLKNNKSIRFANLGESACIVLNGRIQKVEGTHPIREWFFIHLFIH